MIEQQTGKVIEKKYVPENEINTSTISFSGNQVLYSKLRPYLNKVLIPDESGYGTSELVPMNPEEGIIDKFFLAHLLRTNNFVNYINDKVAGAKMPRVNMDTLRDFKIILPPITLQTQFAERVAVIEAQKQQAQLELAKSEALFQSLLQRAFKGELK
jgi:type I restriction enzyme S subunit